MNRRPRAVLAVALAAVLLVPTLDAQARRLGGGRPAGLQRSTPTQPAAAPRPAPQSPTPTPTPTQGAPANAAAKPAPNAAPGTPATTPGATANAANTAGATAAAANAGRRSWLGPVAGLAAGLGLAALASHFGFGAALANAMTLLLLAIVGVVLVRWLMRRLAAPAARGPAFAGGPAMAREPVLDGHLAHGSAQPVLPADASTDPRPGPALGAPSASPVAVPLGGEDAQAFERVAKTLFIRMQAANDAGNVEDLRRFTTPELFGSLRVDLHERQGRPQQTDVVRLDAALVDAAEDGAQQVASVRFRGLIREEHEAGAEPFDEVWHFVRPNDGSRDWAIAGISPIAA